jgi:hypothetical protein
MKVNKTIRRTKMDIKQVFVIINTEKYTKEDIVKDIVGEGYKHHFFFGNFHDYNVAVEYLDKAEEIWCFGDCKDLIYYKLAKSTGADIWQMR